ncbi:MAG: L-aspartate oxidase [Deltaproteobacteria bacterium]|nr:L-aspartate oxidase [Deltaproteobacteria bacterium]
MELETDFLVVGSGIAGLWFALEAAEQGSVIVVTKKDQAESNTNYAQGGIASVFSSQDSFQSHIQDTLNAGAGLCRPEVVRMVIEEGPQEVMKMVERGVAFTRKNKEEFDLGREGGHSARRILHAQDMTGAEIERALLNLIAKNKNISMLQHHFGIDLITSRQLGIRPPEAGGEACLGLYLLDQKTKVVKTIRAKVTLLATGGAGKVYLYTSNPDIATGDGMAMAYRAGARMGNLEFVQFHPTCFFNTRDSYPKSDSSNGRRFLISEAVRGEGAALRLKNGEPFMQKYHPQKELAPRDSVARAIDSELKRTGDDYVLLDITGKPASFIKERFPNIYNQCLRYGVDITAEPIPVVPAAHYFCGGVVTDSDGKTSIGGLYAAGEVSCTGLHGANRLASNSLLEAVVFAKRAAKAAIQEIKEYRPEGPLRGRLHPALPVEGATRAPENDEQIVITHNWEEIRRLMWHYVGIVRSDKRLARAKARIDLLQEEIKEYYWNFRLTSDLLELRNIATVADLVIQCAQARKESRGLHYNTDHPETRREFEKDTVI